MKNLADNAIDGLWEITTSSSLDVEETSAENPSAVTGTTTAGESSQSTEFEAAEETSKDEEITSFDFGETFSGEDNEETSYTVVPPAGSNGGAEIQMPVALFAMLVAAMSILGVVVIFLSFKLKKIGKNSGEEKMQPDSENSEKIQSDSEKNEEHKFSYDIGNVHNIGKREEQQDSFCISDVSNEADLECKGLMAVIADGMGGLESGASVSQLVSNVFLNKYRSSTIHDCKRFLYEAVMEAEQAVEKYLKENQVDGGSTLVAVMIRDGQLSFVSVGDSFIFLIRAGKLIKLNTEHTYGNLLRQRAAKGEIDPEEAEINPKRNSLTSYIGIGNLRLIDQSGTPIPLLDGDILFLCSDGVYNALGDNALLEVVTDGDFGESAERVERSVLMQNIPTQDNFTAVMIKITGGK